MSYQRVNWENSPSNITPINADNLNIMDEGIEQASPTGGIMQFAGATVPEGWLLCDGSEISRTEYASLFAVIGTVYGEGDGSTTFNIPNIKGKIPIGLDSSDTDFNALGKTGGEKTHKLTLQEMPKTIWHAGDANGGLDLLFDKGTSYGIKSNGSDLGQAHNNVQPFIILNYIIKY